MLSLAIGPGCVRPGADRLEFQGSAGFSPLAGSVGRTVVRVDPLAGDALIEDRAHRPDQGAHGGALLLVGEHLDVAQAAGGINGHVGLLIAGTTGGVQTPIAGDPMAHPLETGQLFRADMDHVGRALPPVAMHWPLGLQIADPAKPLGVHHPPDGGEERLEGSCDAAERAPLVP